MFVDSDDYIAITLCEKLHEILSKQPVDVLSMRYVGVTPTYKIYPYRDIFSFIATDAIFSSSEIAKALCEKLKIDFFITTIAHFVFKSHFLNTHHINFIPNRYYEDVLFCTTALIKAQNFYNSSICGYYYFQSPQSTMRGKYNTQKYIKSANDYFYLAQTLHLLSLQEKDPNKQALLQRGSRQAITFLLKPIRKIDYHPQIQFRPSDIKQLGYSLTLPKRINLKYPKTYRFLHPFVVGIHFNYRLARWTYFLSYRATRKTYKILKQKIKD